MNLNLIDVILNSCFNTAHLIVCENKGLMKLITRSVITCPNCGSKKDEEMHIDACQYFYECENCKLIIKPLEGDCCVFCSYGSIMCPVGLQPKSDKVFWK